MAFALALASAGLAAAGAGGLALFGSMIVLVLVGSSATERMLQRSRCNFDRRERAARRKQRDRMLECSPNGRVTLAELTRVVDEIEQRDAERARAFDLDALLDRHATLTLAHDQALRAARMSDRIQLERIRESLRADAAADPRRMDLAERRVQCLAACEAVAESLADELAIVAETIRLIAQRFACPEVPEHDDLIDRQLAELDDTETVRSEIASLCDEPRARSAR